MEKKKVLYEAGRRNAVIKCSYESLSKIREVIGVYENIVGGICLRQYNSEIIDVIKTKLHIKRAKEKKWCGWRTGLENLINCMWREELFWGKGSSLELNDDSA